MLCEVGVGRDEESTSGLRELVTEQAATGRVLRIIADGADHEDETTAFLELVEGLGERGGGEASDGDEANPDPIMP